MIPGKTEVALIQVRQGEKADLRQLEEGQFGYALDTGELYIGAPNEGRLAGREFRNLKLLTELNGVSSATVTLVDVILQTGTENGTMKLIRSYTNGEDVTVDNIPVKNVLTVDNIPDFVSVNDIYNTAIAAGDTTSNKVPSLNSINLTLENRLQYYIRNDKKTSNLIPVGTTDGENVTTPIAVDRTITDRLLNYITKLELPQVITDVSNDYTITTDNITHIYSLYNVAAGTTMSRTLTLPSASASTAGLLTASDYSKMQNYDERISRLEEGGIWRGSYENMVDLPTSITDPSLAGGFADINDFVTVINGMDPNCETGQAVFRLREFDESTGTIPAESLTVTQTVGSSLSNLEIDRMRYKRHTGLDFDTSIIYTYSPEYSYVVTVPSGFGGADYAVGDVVMYRGIRIEVTNVDALGSITGVNVITTSGYEDINEQQAVVSDVSTQARHTYPAQPSATPPTSEAARVQVTSSTNGNYSWVDGDGEVIDLPVYGITYTGTPVNGDELTVVYVASGWGFDYWISMNIAIATEYKEGVVKSSNDISKVSVGLDGTMTVNSYAGHEQRITANAQAITERVAIAQGSVNEGKTLIVDNSGNLVLTTRRLNDGIWDYTNGEFISYPDDPIEDWNDLTSGIYNLTTDSNTLHSVPGDTGGDFHVTTTTYNGKTLQIAIDMSNPLKQYTRVYDGTTWSTWNYAYASWVPGNN